MSQSVQDQVLGETDLSIQKHISQIQVEMKKRDLNLDMLVDKLKRICSKRQQSCQEHLTVYVLKEWPALWIQTLVMNYRKDFFDWQKGYFCLKTTIN